MTYIVGRDNEYNGSGVPVMSKTSFVITERQIGEFWKDELDKYIVEAGAEEKQLAKESGDYHIT